MGQNLQALFATRSSLGSPRADMTHLQKGRENEATAIELRRPEGAQMMRSLLVPGKPLSPLRIAESREEPNSLSHSTKYGQRHPCASHFLPSWAFPRVSPSHTPTWARHQSTTTPIRLSFRVQRVQTSLAQAGGREPFQQPYRRHLPGAQKPKRSNC